MTTSKLYGSQYIALAPKGFRQDVAPGDEFPYPTYGSLLLAFTNYSKIPIAELTYADLMRGHPGYTGGAPERPVGIGVQLGEKRNDVEWWVTNAEGLEGSAIWTPQYEERAVGDGSWVLGVRAPGRQVSIDAHLIAANDDPHALAVAINEAGAVMAAAKRTGWITWDAPDGVQRRLPVALSGATKVKRVGRTSASVQWNVRGVDIGSPGAGAHLESAVPLVHQMLAEIRGIVVPGLVPTHPIIRLQGPLDAGATINLGAYTMTVVPPVLAAQRITIDTRQRYVAVNGTPDRSIVTMNDWPVMQVGAVNTQALFSGTGNITLEVTGLW